MKMRSQHDTQICLRDAKDVSSRSTRVSKLQRPFLGQDAEPIEQSIARSLLHSGQTHAPFYRAALCQDDHHMIVGTKGFTTAGTFPATIGNQSVDTGLAEDMTAELQSCVADVRVADRTDRKSLHSMLAIAFQRVNF